MGKRVAVVLSGCGVYDGAEIHESVITLLHLDRHGVAYQCMAPDIMQAHVVNHLSGEVAANEKRNVLVESARIARGHIIDIANANPADYDAVILPGGFGVAKNLSDFAFKGAECSVQAGVQVFVQAMHKAGKPVGLVCIAPALSALLVGPGVRCTIGHDAETAAAINRMGAVHVECPVNEACVDEDNKLVTTPAYMLAGRIHEAYDGIGRLVDRMLAMV